MHKNCLYNNVHIFMLLPSGKALPDKVNNSLIIRKSISPGGKGVSSVPQQKIVNAVTFRRVLKAVGKNSET